MGICQLAKGDMEIGVSLETYVRYLRKAHNLADYGNYTLNAGEMNPEIFEHFVQTMKDKKLPLVIWEPFAGTSQKDSSEWSISQDYAERAGVTLISYGLKPADKRIQIADSTQKGPNCSIGGMLFHPPYYGTIPMSDDKEDLSFIKDKAEYNKKLGKVIDNTISSMVPNGLVCAVGRDYRCNGERTRLDLLFLQLFENRGFVLKDVWISTPDVVLILCNEV